MTLSNDPVIGDQPQSDGTPCWFVSTSRQMSETDFQAYVADARIENETRAQKSDGSWLNFYLVCSDDPAFVANMSASPDVIMATPDAYAEVLPASIATEIYAPSTFAARLPTGDQLEYQWYHELIKVRAAWDLGVLGAGVTTTLLDSGIPVGMKMRTATICSFVRGQTQLVDARYPYFFGTAALAAMAGETMTLQFQSATPIVVTFGVEATMAAVAAVINAAIGSSGVAAVITQSAGGLPLEVLIIASNDITSASRVRITASTGTVLDKLGFEAGADATMTNSYWQDNTGVRGVRRLAYMKPVFPHPGFDASAIDTVRSQSGFGTDNLNKFTIQRALYSGPGGELDGFRTAGVTSIAATRRLTVATGPTDSNALAATGIQKGDLLVLGGLTFTITNVVYHEPTLSDLAFIFEIDQDWPAALASRTGMRWTVLPDPTDPYRSLVPYFDQVGHSTQANSVHSGTHVPNQPWGIAPAGSSIYKATLRVQSTGLALVTTISNLVATMTEAINLGDIVNVNVNLRLAVADPFIAVLQGIVTACIGFGQAVFCVMGNEGVNIDTAFPGFTTVPTQLTGVTGVAAVGPLNPTGYFANGEDLALNHANAAYESHLPYSNYGASVDLCAPSGNFSNAGSIDDRHKTVDILENAVWMQGMVRCLAAGTKGPETQGWAHHLMRPIRGTSTATPMAVGALKLTLSALRRNRPTATAQEALAILVANLRSLGVPAENYFGAGLIDVRAAVYAALQVLPE